MCQRRQENGLFWEFVLCEHAESGLSVAEFCRQEGVSQASFYQWRKKLSAESKLHCNVGQRDTDSKRLNDNKRDTDDKRGGDKRGGELADIALLLPVEVVPQHVNPQHGGPRSAGSLNPKASLMIRTPDGFAVEVSSETPLDVLGRSLRALRQINSESYA
jgi:hypothetical protein